MRGQVFIVILFFCGGGGLLFWSGALFTYLFLQTLWYHLYPPKTWWTKGRRDVFIGALAVLFIGPGSNQVSDFLGPHWVSLSSLFVCFFGGVGPSFTEIFIGASSFPANNQSLSENWQFMRNISISDKTVFDEILFSVSQWNCVISVTLQWCLFV